MLFLWYNIIVRTNTNNERVKTMSFGSNIRRIRREADMTQEQLADLLNISAQAVSRWETDAAMPDISLLPALANTFHVTTDALLGVDIENNEARIDEMCSNVINFKDGESLEDKIAAFREAVKNNPTSVKLKENYTLLLFLSRAGGIRSDNPDRADEIFSLCEELVNEPNLKERGRDYYLELMSLVNVNDNLQKNEKIKSLVASQCSIKNCAEVILPRCVSGQERLQANKILLLQCMIYGTQALFDLYKDGELLEDADAVIEIAKRLPEMVYGKEAAEWFVAASSYIPYLEYLHRTGQDVAAKQLIFQLTAYMEKQMQKKEGIQSALLLPDYDIVKMFANPQLAKLSIIGSAKEIKKHIEATYADNSEYEDILLRLESILLIDTFE